MNYSDKLNEGLDDYINKVFEKAGKTQKRDIKLTFFAGAFELIYLQTEIKQSHMDHEVKISHLNQLSAYIVSQINEISKEINNGK